MGIVISTGELERLVARRRDQCGERDGHRLTRGHTDTRTQREDRIEHRSSGARKRARRRQDERVPHRAATPDETGTIGFAAHRADTIAAGVHHVHAPEPRVLGHARPARGRDRRTPLVPLRLHEEVGERGVCEIRGLRRHRDFTVTRELDLVGLGTGVRQRHATHLGGVRVHDRDLGLRLDVAVDAHHGDPVGSQPCLAPRRGHTHGLLRGRPAPARRHVVHVAELTGAVGGRIGAPACHGQ